MNIGSRNGFIPNHGNGDGVTPHGDIGNVKIPVQVRGRPKIRSL